MKIKIYYLNLIKALIIALVSFQQLHTAYAMDDLQKALIEESYDRDERRLTTTDLWQLLNAAGVDNVAKNKASAINTCIFAKNTERVNQLLAEFFSSQVNHQRVLDVMQSTTIVDSTGRTYASIFSGTTILQALLNYSRTVSAQSPVVLGTPAESSILALPSSAISASSSISPSQSGAFSSAAASITRSVNLSASSLMGQSYYFDAGAKKLQKRALFDLLMAADISREIASRIVNIQNAIHDNNHSKANALLADFFNQDPLIYGQVLRIMESPALTDADNNTYASIFRGTPIFNRLSNYYAHNNLQQIVFPQGSDVSSSQLLSPSLVPTELQLLPGLRITAVEPVPVSIASSSSQASSSSGPSDSRLITRDVTAFSHSLVDVEREIDERYGNPKTSQRRAIIDECREINSILAEDSKLSKTENRLAVTAFVNKLAQAAKDVLLMQDYLYGIRAIIIDPLFGHSSSARDTFVGYIDHLRQSLPQKGCDNESKTRWPAASTFLHHLLELTRSLNDSESQKNTEYILQLGDSFMCLMADYADSESAQVEFIKRFIQYANNYLRSGSKLIPFIQTLESLLNHRKSMVTLKARQKIALWIRALGQMNLGSDVGSVVKRVLDLLDRGDQLTAEAAFNEQAELFSNDLANAYSTELEIRIAIMGLGDMYRLEEEESLIAQEARIDLLLHNRIMTAPNVRRLATILSTHILNNRENQYELDRAFRCLFRLMQHRQVFHGKEIFVYADEGNTQGFADFLDVLEQAGMMLYVEGLHHASRDRLSRAQDILNFVRDAGRRFNAGMFRIASIETLTDSLRSIPSEAFDGSLVLHSSAIGGFLEQEADLPQNSNTGPTSSATSSAYDTQGLPTPGSAQIRGLSFHPLASPDPLYTHLHHLAALGQSEQDLITIATLSTTGLDFTATDSRGATPLMLLISNQPLFQKLLISSNKAIEALLIVVLEDLANPVFAHISEPWWQNVRQQIAQVLYCVKNLSSERALFLQQLVQLENTMQLHAWLLQRQQRLAPAPYGFGYPQSPGQGGSGYGAPGSWLGSLGSWFTGYR